MNEIYDGSIEPTVLQQRKPIPEVAAKLIAQGVNPLLASLYSARGVSDISEVRGTIDDILPTSQLKNCREMASVLADHIVMRSRVLIISDFDCDGATAGALMYAGFCASGMNVDVVVPDRKKHGYGLSESIVREAALLDPKPDVLITVDSGISSNAGVDLAKSLGMEVLITDHHQAPAVLPDARLIVNPNQPGCPFESKTIAGCGVAWYVCKALADEMADRDYPPGFDPKHLLQFVAIGTVADVVSLDKNNRLLVGEGLRRIRIGECTEGIRALAAVVQKPIRTLTCEDIGFQIGPRINAAGRMSHMKDGIDCLLEMHPVRALEIAERLDGINMERREVEADIAAQANADIERAIEAAQMNMQPGSRCLIVHNDRWHEGVVGIVAGRLKEAYHRPAFVFCRSENGTLKGSGRSIPGFHLKHALDKIAIDNPAIMAAYGGHPAACGVTLNDGMLADFMIAMEEICQKELHPQLLQRVVMHDGSFDWRNFTTNSVAQMNGEVWGQGFPPPVFLDTLQLEDVKTIGAERNHLKATLVIDEVEHDVIAFGQGERAATLPSELTVLHRPNVRWYDYQENLQVMVANIPAEHVLQAYLHSQSGLEAVEAAKRRIEEELKAGHFSAPRVYRP